MDELNRRFADLKARHSRLAVLFRGFVAAGLHEAALAAFLTAELVFDEGQVVHAQQMEALKR